MSICHHFRTILLSISIGSVTLLHAEDRAHSFDVESGMVIYEISGGTQLTPETNLSISGNVTLRFKEWGDVKMEEESGVVLTTGTIQHKQDVQRSEKHTKETVITVDYENEQLLERKKTASENINYDETASLVQNGQESVAGIMCDVWEGPGIKKCIYKNLVLKLESDLYDISYLKVATKAVFDINTSNEEECQVPDYPVQEFALLKDNIKTKNEFKSENFCKILNDKTYDIQEGNISDGINTLTDEERRNFINQVAQDIYNKQKQLLPKLLKSMKKSRECLHTVEDPVSANQCLEDFNQMKEELGRERDEYIILWNDERKTSLLDQLEDEIIYLQSRISCVNRAKNITDLSSCMK
ncbi:MAG TPA: hypothetical protein VLL31_03755 [Sulfurovum sp.]|nr:hypothetical protein [Sulfurovum sp.]